MPAKEFHGRARVPEGRGTPGSGRWVLVLLLVAAWLALSGSHTKTPLIFGFGVGSVLLVTWLAARMSRQSGADPYGPRLLGLLLRLPRYLAFLFVKIVRSNLRVTRLLLDPRVSVKPRLLRMRSGPRSELGQVIYANSITLTPGTVTLDLRDDELLVHALGPVSAHSVVNGEIDRAVRRLEGESAGAERA